jgi:hypothetical protein
VSRPRAQLTGTVWGSLEVAEAAPSGPDRRTRVRCRCLRCGSWCTVRTDQLYPRRGLDARGKPMTRARTCGCHPASPKRAPNWAQVM